MKPNIENKKTLIRARDQVRKMKIFYIHLIGYIIVAALISYNFYIIEEGVYKDNIMALNTSILVAWTVFIIVHALVVFKPKLFFKRSWEDKKIKEFLEGEMEEETTFWE